MPRFSRLLSRIAAGLCLGLASLGAGAHFVILYTPDTALVRAQDVPFTMVFTHIYAASPTMPMAKPQRFYYSKKQSVGSRAEEVDLMPYLEPIEWQAGEGTVQAWQANVPREAMRSLGDYQVVVEPEPYLEEAEGLYIQQFTKVMVNVGGVPGSWAETLGLPAEIEALNKPYANWTDGTFRGIVLSDGIPVPYTQVEVNYLNHPLDVENRRFAEEGLYEAPHPAFETMVILTNEFGEFSFNMPRAGWWGFAALGVGPEYEYNDMPLSQDAILWVQAVDFPDKE